MGVSLLFTMRTANRAPKRNYLGQTVRSLLAQGVRGEDIHVFASDAEWRWMKAELGEDIHPAIHVPAERRTPNANGLAPIALLDLFPADWIILSEDDLEWCADPLGSMARWLHDHATPSRRIYRFFAFDPLIQTHAPWAAVTHCREMKGSQAVALRTSDARRFKAWAETHVTNWRPKGAPFQDRPHDGFDKLLGYWALSEDPVATSLVSTPFFVRHVGTDSAIHRRAIHRDRQFAGTTWRYTGQAVAV